jgi:hypothetical protein
MLNNCWNECYQQLPWKKASDIDDDAAQKLFNNTILDSTIPPKIFGSIGQNESFTHSVFGTNLKPVLNQTSESEMSMSARVKNVNILKDKTTRLLKSPPQRNSGLSPLPIMKSR